MQNILSRSSEVKTFHVFFHVLFYTNSAKETGAHNDKVYQRFNCLDVLLFQLMYVEKESVLSVCLLLGDRMNMKDCYICGRKDTKYSCILCSKAICNVCAESTM